MGYGKGEVIRKRPAKGGFTMLTVQLPYGVVHMPDPLDVKKAAEAQAQEQPVEKKKRKRKKKTNKKAEPEAPPEPKKKGKRGKKKGKKKKKKKKYSSLKTLL